VDDDAVTALEVAIADLGTFLVQMDKFRAAETDEARALRGAALAVGDRARRAHRRGALDATLASELSADVAATHAALAAWLGTVRTSATYRRAVDALGRGDDLALRASVHELFAGVRVVEPPAALFHAVTWQRRGRPLPAADVVTGIVRLRDDGLPPEHDETTAGVDPELPGVILQVAPPLGAPVYLVFRDAARPAWVVELPSGDVVVPGSTFGARFTVGLADPDDDELDGWTLDPATYRRELTAALRARDLPIDAG
jgi:hypothetical protein